jgi:hypothetical protein
VQVLKIAQETADESAIWRKPTRSNLTSLLLLFFITASGDLTSLEAEHYLSAACSQFRSLFPNFDSLVNVATGVPEWSVWATGIADVARALETRTFPFL